MVRFLPLHFNLSSSPLYHMYLPYFFPFISPLLPPLPPPPSSLSSSSLLCLLSYTVSLLLFIFTAWSSFSVAAYSSQQCSWPHTPLLQWKHYSQQTTNCQHLLHCKFKVQRLKVMLPVVVVLVTKHYCLQNSLRELMAKMLAGTPHFVRYYTCCYDAMMMQ